MHDLIYSNFKFHHEYSFVCMWYISFHVLKRREMFPIDLSPKIAPHTYELSEPRVKGRSGLCRGSNSIQ